ncbi:MAG: glycosyl transferase family 1, partial [Acidimicrobiaceae bacterium]|nr:glycosyl transferase family 1 [Acidimicrobiaceae bacterium]
MSTAPSSPVAEGSVLIDAAALQSPATRVRGIGRYAAQWVVALEKLRPDLVGCYLLDPALAPPGILEPLSSSGKLRYRGDPAVAIDRYRLIHSLSPLDLEVPFAATWPGAAHRAGLARSATVYDLIPALDPDRELADPLVRLRYATRLGAVRSAEQLHVLSASVGRDLVQHLGMDPDRIVLVGAGPAADFSPASGPGDLALAAQLLGGLDRPFVLHPGGSHPRKNTEALLQAWALLPARTRTKHRLVLVGAVPSSTQNHYRHLARLGGFTENLVVLGEVTDDALRSCYRAAALVCFPSLAEGYGLPVVEAIACGTPVIASDIPPLDELLAPPARFDPSSAETIAGALRDALESPKRMTQIRDAARAPDDFAAVARRSAEAFDRLLAERRSRPRPRPRPLEAVRKPRRRLRIAFVSPFPPAPTGVAAYSHRLVEELLATGEVEVDVYLDGP